MKNKMDGVNLNQVIDAAIARVKTEAAEHAAKLGLPAKDAKRAAAAEHLYWETQSEKWEGPELWRSFEESLAARVRCLWALEYCLNPLRHIEQEPIDGSFLSSIRNIDRNLEVLRTYAPKAAPGMEPSQYRAWVKQDRLEGQIRKLEKKLDVERRRDAA
jgi:hypothetical protein